MYKWGASPHEVASGIAVPEQEHVRAQLFQGDATGLGHPLLYLTHSLH